MNLDFSKTIFAISTPPGVGAIAIVRVSGKDSHAAVRKLFTAFKAGDDFPEHAKAYYGKILDDAGVIDYPMCTFFYAPQTYTGEDSVEIYCHGSQYIQDRILQALSSKGLSAAEHGEFTLRAFINGKMDLVQAEGVNDLINSSGNFSHQQAVNQLRGHFSSKLQTLRKDLIDLISLFELELDFAEEDVEFADRSQLLSTCEKLKAETDKLLESFRLGNVVKSGIPVAIIGEPNVGKSTLLNQMLGEERSIVCDVPGTTRDSIEDSINIGEFSFRFIDTAGIRSTEDVVESIGVSRAFEKANMASIILLLFDVSDFSKSAALDIIENLKGHVSHFSEKKLIIVLNKVDLVENHDLNLNVGEYKTVCISAKNNSHLEDLKNVLQSYAGEEMKKFDVVLTNARHFNSLSAASEALSESIEHIKCNLPNDLTSISLNEAVRHIGSITGEVSNDDILDNVFRNFCIGK